MTALAEDTDLSDLWRRLGDVEQRVREAVAARAATDPAPTDPYRGLYLTREAMERLLTTPAQSVAFEADDLAPGTRLATLARRFGLSRVDVELLLVALTPDVDARFERLYGYLNDDVTRRRATIGLALELCGEHSASSARFRLSPSAPLVAGGLMEVREPHLPALSRVLQVPDRIVAHLLGDDTPDPEITPIATVLTGISEEGFPTRLAATLLTCADPELSVPRGTMEPGAGGRPIERPDATRQPLDATHWPIHLRDTDGAHTAVAALAAAGRPALVVNVVALADVNEPPINALVREARLRGAGIVLGPVETLSPQRIRQFATAAQNIPLLFHGTQFWDPKWTDAVPVTVPRLATSNVPAALSSFRLNAGEVDRATAVATRLAALDGQPVTQEHLRAGVRAQNGAGLDRLARRIVPSVGWPDLVLPEPTQRQLTELVRRARYRERVLGEWRMRPGGGRGHGVVALFAGESGTGKTMSAEVVAAELGMDLYVVDLSTVVDKYVGETEKNLERIFTEAAGVHGVLLFDEADAVFGKRSAVKDAHDRYANVESAYLLQRMESFDGIAVLTTNLRSNVDDAFTRRLDVIADFPVPDAQQRLALWDRGLGDAMPRADDLDLPFCANNFELAGGSIRACAITAAYLAAAADRPVAMADVVDAVRQEYRKLGRLVLASEFGAWAG